MVNFKSICYLFIFTLVSACSFKESDRLPSYTLVTRDFENILSINGFVEPVNSTSVECPRFVDGVVAYLIEDGTYVEEGDTVCKLEMQMLQTQYDQMVTDLENARAGFNKSKAELHLQYTLMEAQVKNNEAETQIASLDSLQLIYASPNQRRIKELELRKTLIDKEKYKKKLEALEIINQSEIRRLEIEIQQFEMRLQSMKEQLDKLIITAPKRGLAMRPIYRLTNSPLNIGDPVWGGMPLITIPDVNEMKVKIMAPEQEYKSINVDDSVYFTFNAMPENLAWGKITKKAPVGQPYKENSKIKYFEIEASIDSCVILPEPGFTANCHIILQEVTDALIVPQIAVFREDSLKVVFVEQKNGYEMRQVQTGISSPKESVITAGVKEFEKISLSRPRDSYIKKRIFLPDLLEVKTDSLNIIPDSLDVK